MMFSSASAILIAIVASAKSFHQTMPSTPPDILSAMDSSLSLDELGRTPIDLFWNDVLAPVKDFNSNSTPHEAISLTNATSTTNETYSAIFDQFCSEVIAPVEQKLIRNVNCNFTTPEEDLAPEPTDDESHTMNTTITTNTTTDESSGALVSNAMTTLDEGLWEESDFDWTKMLCTSLANHHQPKQNYYYSYEDIVSGEFKGEYDSWSDMICFPFEHYYRTKQNRQYYYYYFEDVNDLTLTANHMEVIDENQTDQELQSAVPPSWRFPSFLTVLRLCTIIRKAMKNPTMPFIDIAQQEAVFWNEDDEFTLSMIYTGLFTVVALGFAAIVSFSIGCTWVFLKMDKSWLVKQDAFRYMLWAALVYLFSGSCVIGLLVCERFYHYQFASQFWLSVIVGAVFYLVVWILILIRQRYQKIAYSSLLVKAHRNRFVMGNALVDRLQAQYDKTRDIMNIRRLALSLKQAIIYRDGTFEIVVTARCDRTQALQRERVFRISNILSYHGACADAVPLDLEFNWEANNYSTPSHVPVPWDSSSYKAPSIIYPTGSLTNERSNYCFSTNNDKSPCQSVQLGAKKYLIYSN